jgi:hypothetical protein
LKILGLIVGALASNQPGKRGGYQPYEKVELIIPHLDEGEFAARIFEGKEKAGHLHLYRVPVVAMMMRTYLVSPEVARVFWLRVRDGEMLLSNSPEHQLRTFLLTSCAKSTPGQLTSASKRVPAKEFEYRIALAWNDYRRDRAGRQPKYITQAKMPALI